VTRTLRVDPARPEREHLAEAAGVLLAGGLVAFPTETVYGLGADARNEAAVRRIFEAKGRPADNPLIVHVGDVEMAEGLAASFPDRARGLIDRFWPGPLTLVMQRAPHVPALASAGLPSIALRMPDHPVALGLVRAAGAPVAAPSANRSGRPSPTTAAHVLADLQGRVELVLDGGPCRVGVESTVVDVRQDPVVLLRLGAVTEQDLAAVVGRVAVHPAAAGLPDLDIGEAASPGMRHRHYAPRARVVVFAAGAAEAIAAARRTAQADRHVVGLIVSDQTADLLGDVDRLVRSGPREEPGVFAVRLYAALRSLDEDGVDVVLVEAAEATGVGAAVNDRLRRAAAGAGV